MGTGSQMTVTMHRDENIFLKQMCLESDFPMRGKVNSELRKPQNTEFALSFRARTTHPAEILA